MTKSYVSLRVVASLAVFSTPRRAQPEPTTLEALLDLERTQNTDAGLGRR